MFYTWSHPHFTGFSWLQSEMRLRNADSDKLTNRWNCTENNNKKWQSQTDNLVPVYSYRRYDKSHITLIYILADLYNDRKNCCTVCTALLYILRWISQIPTLELPYGGQFWGWAILSKSVIRIAHLNYACSFRCVCASWRVYNWFSQSRWIYIKVQLFLKCFHKTFNWSKS